ncbi:MAG: NAD(P)H-dependent oxidoreductase subunit E [Acidobacteria bacterium]|nr:NAD(P)H-dependent oxidoreductase subunit E [Acidobacteriota bacterium]
MDALKVRIDGMEVSAGKGTTILEAAQKAGIHIPTLCYHPNLRPTGSCRVCVVEVEGSNRLAGSCHTPVEAGMVIHTRSAKVLEARKATVELLLAGHTGPCVNDYRAAHCDLHNIAAEIQAGPPRFRSRKPRCYPPEDSNPYVRRDMSKCILCGRCIGVCSDIAGKKFFSTAYRGFRSKVVVDFDEPLDKEICRDCLLCIDYCPTTALSRPGQADRAKIEPESEPDLPLKAAVDRKRAGLLPELKRAQENFHCVPQGFMADTARSMNLSPGDVYGVATFYSFLSTRPTGENVIRVCKSLPCYLKNSRKILECIEETLGIRPGETTPDGTFSLELASCIGACDRAPAMLVNGDVHGGLTPRKIAKILKSYQTGGKG